MAEWFAQLKADFELNFIEAGRWKWLMEGLGNTLIITFFALLIGLVIGVVVAAIRSTYDKNRESMAMHKGAGYYLLKIANGICHVYLTVFRGTPIVVQLLIMYFIVFATSRDSLMIAIIAFGVNSGSYVAEILRGGIMSIDNGQFEAGRSLGFNYPQTMLHIIIPQVFKNVLPTLCNEFIVLLKETSVAGYVAVRDITKAGDQVRNITYDAVNPLLTVALTYLGMVVILTALLSLLEKRLAKSDKG
jgi:His/Glu/Gln/Arg/opine family amino acid ABC transporter permease subunit